MNLIFPKEIRLKNGEKAIIREAEKADAASILDYISVVADETEYLTFGANEFSHSLKEEEAIIETHRKALNRIFLLAEVGGQIAGLLNVTASMKPRLRHVGEFGITVKKAHWGKGLGAALISGMLEWAKASGMIRKINLIVNEDNLAAIKLYEKFGFEIEGKFRRDIYINGRFCDAFLMGILID